MNLTAEGFVKLATGGEGQPVRSHRAQAPPSSPSEGLKRTTGAGSWRLRRIVTSRLRERIRAS